MTDAWPVPNNGPSAAPDQFLPACLQVKPVVKDPVVVFVMCTADAAAAAAAASTVAASTAACDRKGEREEHFDYDDVYDDGMMTMVVRMMLMARMATRIMTLDSDDDDVDVAVDKLRSILMMWMLMMAMLMKAKLMVTSMTNMLRRYGGWLGTIARLLLTMTTKMPDDDECSRDMIIRMDRIVMIVIMIMSLVWKLVMMMVRRCRCQCDRFENMICKDLRSA